LEPCCQNPIERTPVDLEVLYNFTGPDRPMRYVALFEPRTRLVLCLVGHASNKGERFSESHTGLDHLEFLVDRRDDLDEWVEKPNRLAIRHPGV